MRSFLGLVLIILLTPTGAAPSHPEVAPVHSASVAAVLHVPAQPARGDPVSLLLQVHEGASLDKVNVVYCRVQRYACAPALTATRGIDNRFSATIPWHADFFRGVTDVGYQFELHHTNGTRESSPVDNPADAATRLPPDAGTYYFYSLPKESPAVPVIVLVALVFLLVGARSRPQ